MSTTASQNEEIFNTMHKLEQAGMSRKQAETNARAIDRQTSNGIQLVLDKLDEIKKKNFITNTIVGIGFAGIFIGLIGIIIALLSIN